MKVSVIVPVYNRENFIKKCLDSLLSQTFQGYEIIVIDDASNDGTNKVLKLYDEPRIKVFCNADRGGYCLTRNEGIRRACGDIIAFIDSDCVAGENWLEEIVKPFEHDESIMIVTGKVFDPSYGNYWQKVNKGGDFVANARGYVKRSLAGNMAIRRQFFDHNQFDPNLSDLAGEEFDLSLCCRKQGFKIFYQPSAEVIHYRRTEFTSSIKQQFYYGLGNTYVRFKHKHFPFISYGGWIIVGAVFCGVIAALINLFWFRVAWAFTLLYFALVFYVSIQGKQKKWKEAIIFYPGYLLRSLSNSFGSLYYFYYWPKKLLKNKYFSQ